MWKVLIVEDDTQMREFFAASIGRCEELSLAASLGTLTEATKWLSVPGQHVDVILTDLGLPDGSGLDVIRHAVRLHPGCEILVISVFGDEDNVLASIEAGALGYIHKDSSPENIADAILEMKAGASPISPMIARRVLSKYRKIRQGEEDLRSAQSSGPPAGVAPGAADRPALSVREHEMLELIARGFTYLEIARIKTVSVHTVQSHIKNLYRKLAVNSKSEAVFEATQLGLLRPTGK